MQFVEDIAQRGAEQKQEETKADVANPAWWRDRTVRKGEKIGKTADPW